MSDQFLTTEQAAQYLSLSKTTLPRWRWSGDGPKFVKLGRAVRYRVSDLDEWTASRTRANTCKEGGNDV